MTTILEDESFRHDEDDDDEELDLRRPGENIVLDDDDDDEDDEDEDDDDFDPTAATAPVASKMVAALKTKKHRKSSIISKGGGGGSGAPPSAAKRRRRRSSARFLRMSPDEDAADDEDAASGSGGGKATATATSLDNLGEVYQKAIRMNAENRINAANSWNLNLIDHLDRFVAPELRSTNMANNMTMDDTISAATGVNFTKASCTLDASVKIYSYRVDDVHLTSYKVLANLNRTDTNKNNNNNNDSGDKNGKNKNNSQDATDGEEGSGKSHRSGNKSGGAVNTLEHNLSNINIHKLDAAFDIDPLFHKMSKTFDEGGAKGLLLANLGVSYQANATGCKIVFDSSLDDDGTTEEEAKESNDGMDSDANESPFVDVASLVAKVNSLVEAGAGHSAHSIHDMPLVPQLASLRLQFAELEQGGFVDHRFVATKRYASTREEEAEADRSIHIEAIERSRASQADLGRSLMAQDSSDQDSLGLGKHDEEPDDFGGGDFDDGDDTGFADFHDGDHRFSSESFQAISSFDGGRLSSGSAIGMQQKNSQPAFSQARILLDAIASGDISTSQSNNPYEYFNSQALATLSSGNMWAGADHWKKMIKPKKTTVAKSKDGDNSSQTAEAKKKRRKAKASSAADRMALVDITNPIGNLKELMKKPAAAKRGSTSAKLLWTKAMQTKHSNIDNLLPTDARIGVKELTTLFLRPDTNLASIVSNNINNGIGQPKTVGFGGVETWGSDNGGYSDNDDDGGFGVDFGGDSDDGASQDFVVPDLEGVRKVEKIKVGYATVAKKVDVKRLKHDLWEELERTFQQRGEMLDELQPETDPLEKEIMSESVPLTELSVPPKPNGGQGPISFQETVRDMQTSQSQPDVTLPFYFICVLHLCNENGLTLESRGLDDFVIHSS